MAPTVLITGASRGLGLATASILLNKFGANVVAVSRTRTAELDSLAASHAKRLTILTGDVSKDEDNAKVCQTAVGTYGSLDGLILNAGCLDPLIKIRDMDISECKTLFDVNFFSLISILKHAILHLDKSKGKVVFVSSGAAVGGSASWGAYNTSKAAMNSLCRTVASEEPNITFIAVRPGVVDTQMQIELREKGKAHMSEKDYAKFKKLHEDGALLPAEKPGHVLAALALKADHSLSGSFHSWETEPMAPYRD